MAVQARFDEREALGALRSTAHKLKEHPRTTSLMARLAFFSQPEPLNLPMASRLTRTDRHFDQLIETGFRHTQNLLCAKAFTTVPEAMDAVGESRSRRIFALMAFGWWATVGMSKVGAQSVLLVQQAAAIGHIMSLMARPDHDEHPDAHFALGVACQAGIPLMAVHFGDAYVQVLAGLEHSGKSLVEAEIERLGLSHADAARVLFETLGAHEKLIDAVSLSHEPMGKLKDAALHLNIAETTALTMGYDAGTEAKPPEMPTTWLIRMGVKPFATPDTREELAREAALAACYFGA